MTRTRWYVYLICLSMLMICNRGKRVQAEVSSQTNLESERARHADLKVCKAQLASRDCRIQELRQALITCSRHGMWSTWVVHSFCANGTPSEFCTVLLLTRVPFAIAWWNKTGPILADKK